MTPQILRFRGPGLLALAVFFPLVLGLAAPLSGAAPVTLYHLLEKRAATEGAAAVRGEYRRLTDEILAELATPAPHPTLAESLRRNLRAAWFHELLRSWARVEARDVRAGKTSVSFAAAVVVPLVTCLEAAHFEADRTELERLRAAASPEELARLGLTVSPVASFDNDRTQALRQTALLAKLGKNVEALERIFEMSGGRVDTCTTPAEFLAFPHEWESVLGGVR